MDRELYRETFSRLTASPQTKEELLHMTDHEKTSGRRGIRRAARLALAAAAVLCVLTVTAFAASGSFRAAVTRLLFPAYGADELADIDGGHRTGSFDRTDVLNTFLEDFDREGLGDGFTMKLAGGFHKEVLEEDEDTAAVAVETSDPEVRVVVYLDRQAYSDTAGLWQVTGYRVENVATGETLHEGNFHYETADGETGETLYGGTVTAIPTEDGTD